MLNYAVYVTLALKVCCLICLLMNISLTKQPAIVNSPSQLTTKLSNINMRLCLELEGLTNQKKNSTCPQEK